ncbi:hypothetical protein K466DRAFT_301526 [Polyporus arcularius HHB13444]|uniref:HMG box domain-containing protein n=1 Tax=Polyporus arcularius HHB13444 TaxID=1314778 RepID=A0A5C3P0A8_9APHY|nr:hypothetical protein K466DRAFT_301526 [Polyporus arcularius HHB13444]
MPAFRNIRRSRRISRQPPRDPNTDEYDLYDLHLIYPGSSESSPFTTATTPDDDASYSPADDAGEPEVDPDSPPLPPTSIRSFPAQRSSHSRKRDPDYVPRPPNAFMIFRSDLWNTEKIKDTVERDHRQISRIAGELWNKMTPAQRAPYHAKADEAKRLHAIAHPNYKYTPIYRKDRGGKRKAKPDHTDKIHRCQQVARLMQRGYLGDDLKKELEKQAAAGNDDYSSDQSDEYVEGPRRKRARKSSAKKVTAAAPRSRHPRLAKAEVKYGDDDGQDLVTFPLPATLPVKCEHPSVAEPHITQQSVSPALYDVSPPSSDIQCGDEFVATADIPDFSLGEPASDCEVQFTNPFSSDFSRSPETPYPSLSPASGYLSLSDDFLDFAADADSPKLSSPDNAFIGIVNDKLCPLTNPFEIYVSDYGFESANAVYAYDDQASADSEFSDWMRYDNCAEPSH